MKAPATLAFVLVDSPALIHDDPATLTRTLHDAYITLVNMRPNVIDRQYSTWQRTVRNVEDVLQIDRVERYTNPQE